MNTVFEATQVFQVGAMDLLWRRFQHRSNEWKLHWLLRLGVFMEFVGHGACGVHTKAGWLPYFHVFGISEVWAWRLMPVVGSIDITFGFIALLAPRRAVLLYMAVWGCFTALLRPASGQGWFEFIERAYNYGIPLALLLLHGMGTDRTSWFASLKTVKPLPARRAKMLLVLFRAIVALMLIGHGGFGVIMKKPNLITFYQAAGLGSIGLPMETIRAGVGWFEICLGVFALFATSRAFFAFVCAWKVGSELLYVVSGARMACWEVMERGGSYIAPLAALCVLTVLRSAQASEDGQRSGFPGDNRLKDE